MNFVLKLMNYVLKMMDLIFEKVECTGAAGGEEGVRCVFMQPE